MLAIARALPSSFARALRSPPDSGLGRYFGAIRTSGRKEIGCELGSGLQRREPRPAPIFLMPAGALRAGVCERPLRNVLPACVAAIQSDCIGCLDFHCPLAAPAG